MLRPYIEELTFIVRTDHDALCWLMTISDSTGHLMRRRLRLSDFDFTVKYRPGLVHQVPDAFSRILTPEGNDDKPIEDEVPTYGDHEAVFVTTRRKAANVTPNLPATTTGKRITRKRTARTATDERRMNTKGTAQLTDEERLLIDFQQNHIDHNTTNDNEAIDDVQDDGVDIFDMLRAYQDDGRVPLIAEVPVRSTKDELLEAQSTDDFCQTVFSRQLRNLDTHFSKVTSAFCDENIRLTPRSSKLCYPTRSDPVCSTSPITRYWPATPDRPACIDISAKRITGRRWPPIYTKQSVTVRPVRRNT